MFGKRLLVYWVAVVLIGASVFGCQKSSSSEPPAKKSTLLPLKWLREIVALVKPAVPDTAAMLVEQADRFRTQGRTDLAEKHYRQALAIRESAWGAEHPKVAPSLDAFATYYIMQGDYAKAEELLQRSLALRGKADASQNPDLVITLTKYADVLRKMGRAQEASPFEQRAQTLQGK